jgi:hypothetical protein
MEDGVTEPKAHPTLPWKRFSLRVEPSRKYMSLQIIGLSPRSSQSAASFCSLRTYLLQLARTVSSTKAPKERLGLDLIDILRIKRHGVAPHEREVAKHPLHSIYGLNGIPRDIEHQAQFSEGAAAFGNASAGLPPHGGGNRSSSRVSQPSNVLPQR